MSLHEKISSIESKSIMLQRALSTENRLRFKLKLLLQDKLKVKIN